MGKAGCSGQCTSNLLWTWPSTLTSLKSIQLAVSSRADPTSYLKNAAILAQPNPTSSPPYNLSAALQDSFTTNTIGVANVTEAFLPLLHEAVLPRIVMISSRAGSLDARSKWVATYTTTKYYAPAYDCSKAALNMLTLHYKNSLPGKFKVNACCPGFCVSSSYLCCTRTSLIL